jgi:hypothetical protein
MAETAKLKVLMMLAEISSDRNALNTRHSKP